MAQAHHEGGSPPAVAYAIAAVIAGYLIALYFGWPQLGTKRIVEGASHHAVTTDGPADVARPVQPHAIVAPPLWTVIPFVVLLAAIALLPLIPATAHWWESNLSRFLVALALSAI